MGKPDDGTRLEPTVLPENHEPGGCDDSTKTDQNAICPRGVLSGIVLRGWESQPQGEGPDGSTPQGYFLRGAQLAKETYAGHAGSDERKPTSLRGIAIESCNGQL